MLVLSGLFIYPIKSLGGISVSQAVVQERGLQYDRRWLVVDKDGLFLTQRTLPQMATIRIEVTPDGLLLHSQHSAMPPLQVSIEASGPLVEVQIWGDRVPALEVAPDAHTWLSEALGTNCRLVYMPDDSRRLVDAQYAHNGELTSFSDGFPFLILGQASLDDLNDRLDEPVPADRFRSNFLVSGSEAFAEDGWRRFRIGEVEFEVLKPCARCVVVTTDQQTGQRLGREPLRTLATYRNQGGKVYFAQNVVARSLGTVRVGDPIEVLSRCEPLFAT